MIKMQPRDFVNRSAEIAFGLKHKLITPDHLMICLLEYPVVQYYLNGVGIDTGEMTDDIVKHLESIGPSDELDEITPSADFNKIILTAVAKTLGSILIQDLALVCLKVMMELPVQSCVSTMLLGKLGAHSQTAVGGVATKNAPSTEEAADRKMLLTYCIDLNEIARTGKIDPLIGRDREVEDVIRVLARRRKNNPVLVGEPGVGKTAIPEGLALRIVEGKVPDAIADSNIYALDLPAMIAGTRFRGDFEERLKNLITAVEKYPNIILYVDELHLIMSAGGNGSGSIDAANILKPALARGTLRMIGATTNDEFRKHIEKDRATLRRFHRIDIAEPTLAETTNILLGIKARYEEHHNIVITTAAIAAAVSLSDRYITTSVMPDKAIDLIDGAGAHQRVFGSELGPWTVDVSEIEAEVARISKMPLSAITVADEVRLASLDFDLNSCVVGQQPAIDALVASILISRAGLRDLNKTEGAYLFVGPTGVGKTEVARALAQKLNRPLLRYDMSEFMERHSAAKLIGAPPGYAGFGEGGAGAGKLINDINDHPDAILLLDEIEKAHEDVFNIFLQVMDFATLTGSNGKKADFRNIMLIMTSNVGSGRRSVGAGFGAKAGRDSDEDVAKAFSPEFRNRLDAVVPFSALSTASMLLIVDKFVGELCALASGRSVEIVLDQDARIMLAKLGYDPEMGARPLKRVISKEIKEPLSKLMLFGALKNGGRASIGWTEERFSIAVEESVSVA